MKLKEIWGDLRREENQSIYLFIRKLFFVVVFVSAVIVVGTILTLKNYDDLEKKTLKEIEESVLAAKLENIQEEVKSVTSDLMMLSEATSLKNYYKNPTGNLQGIENEFYNMSKHHEVFDQVRLIDEKGMEIVRVNYNNGQPIIVDKGKLQDKSYRYYFYDSFKLNRNEVFISPLDLNVENGEIDQPVKPMIRFATPVFNQDGKKKGVVVLNYFGRNIIKHFLDGKNPLIKGQLMFLNSEGYWFKGANADYDWGFMYEDKKDLTFENIYGNVWDSIDEGDHSQFDTQQGMFTFKTVNPIPKRLTPISNTSQNNDNYHWKIVSFIPFDLMQKNRNRRKNQAIFILVVLFVSWSVIFYRLVKNQYYKLISQRELKKREVRLAELNATKDKLFSIIGHDLINPLNRIEGFSDLLVEYMAEKNYEGVNEYAKIIKNSSNQATGLLSNLLEWSRSQIGGISFRPVNYKLNDQLLEVLLLLSDVIHIKSISIKEEIPMDFLLYADKEMISTILRNLISNAIKFTHKNGEIIVTAEKKDHKIFISVCDNGVGMDENQLKGLFEIGENNTRLGTEKEKGTGLGLVLCNEFIKKHGGNIWVESKVDKGSCFKISLPNN